MADRCAWCNTDPDEAAARHEGPHATWCPHHRAAPLPPGVRRAGGRLVCDGLEATLTAIAGERVRADLAFDSVTPLPRLLAVRSADGVLRVPGVDILPRV